MRVSLLAPLHRDHKLHHQPGLVAGVARTSSRADNARSATRGKAKRYKITPRKQHAHMIGICDGASYGAYTAWTPCENYGNHVHMESMVLENSMVRRPDNWFHRSTLNANAFTSRASRVRGDNDNLTRSIYRWATRKATDSPTPSVYQHWPGGAWFSLSWKNANTKLGCNAGRH